MNEVKIALSYYDEVEVADIKSKRVETLEPSMNRVRKEYLPKLAW